jgi:hypothetical protein
MEVRKKEIIRKDGRNGDSKWWKKDRRPEIKVGLEETEKIKSKNERMEETRKVAWKQERQIK